MSRTWSSCCLWADCLECKNICRWRVGFVRSAKLNWNMEVFVKCNGTSIDWGSGFVCGFLFGENLFRSPRATHTLSEAMRRRRLPVCWQTFPCKLKESDCRNAVAVCACACGLSLLPRLEVGLISQKKSKWIFLLHHWLMQTEIDWLICFSEKSSSGDKSSSPLSRRYQIFPGNSERVAGVISRSFKRQVRSLPTMTRPYPMFHYIPIGFLSWAICIQMHIASSDWWPK